MANPLSKDDLVTINDNLTKLKEAKEEIKRAKLAGFDVSEEEKQVESLEAQLLRVKSAYFPRST